MKIEMDEASGWVSITVALCLLVGWWSHSKSCETISLSTKEECARACGVGNVVKVNSAECVCGTTLDAGGSNDR
jgi:hypothetical protein